MKKRQVFKGQKAPTDANKGWRDAFIEANIIKKEQLSNYSGGDCVRITDCGSCIQYTALSAYVSQFDKGGFWVEGGTIYFTTHGMRSDEEASYEDAKEFLAIWKATK